MTTHSDQDVASACRWLDGKLGGRGVFSWDTSADTLGERIIATARALGWTPSPPAPVFTEAEALAFGHQVRLAAVEVETRGRSAASLDLPAILNRIRGGRG